MNPPATSTQSAAVNLATSNEIETGQPNVRMAWPARPLFTATRMVNSTKRIRRFASGLFILLAIMTVVVALLPWQQSARGTGSVLAFKPGERQQVISSPVEGIVAGVPEDLFEGMPVKQGDLLLEIKPLAADLQQQLEGQLTNLEGKLKTEEAKAAAYAEVVAATKNSRDAAVRAAMEDIKAAEAKLSAKEKLIPGYESKLNQATLNYNRQRSLERQQIAATKELEKERVNLDFARAELNSVLQEVEQAKAELQSKKEALEEKRNDAQSKVDKAIADQQAAFGAMETVRKEMRDLQIKQGELDRLSIHAPRDGFIHRLPVFIGGQMVKKGDYLLTFVPKTDDHAVELLIRGNDMPLVEPGDHVRLQFEGWPALQFSGWPSVAVGTFGGEVALVDPTDDGTGQFRVLVTPTVGEPWPEDAYLRQGVRANGWVMLGTVSLAFEIWRQLNGFPPVIEPDSKKESGKDAAKRPKLPK